MSTRKSLTNYRISQMHKEIFVHKIREYVSRIGAEVSEVELEGCYNLLCGAGEAWVTEYMYILETEQDDEPEWWGDESFIEAMRAYARARLLVETPSNTEILVEACSHMLTEMHKWRDFEIEKESQMH